MGLFWYDACMTKRRTFRYDKLVRDKIVPEMIANGDEVDFEVVEDDVQYLRCLLEKLIEEATEASRADLTEADELLAELGDIEEIIDAILILRRLTRRQLNAAKLRKHHKRGGFRSRHFIRTTAVVPDSPWLGYYLERPDQYPEVIDPAGVPHSAET